MVFLFQRAHVLESTLRNLNQQLMSPKVLTVNECFECFPPAQTYYLIYLNSYWSFNLTLT